jgi:queuine tRNA-ribosyltransferase
MFSHLSERTAAGLKEIGFHGYAVGGLAVGEPQEMMFETLDFAMCICPSTNRAI